MNSQADLDAIVCNTSTSSDTNVPSDAAYKTFGATKLNSFVGIALTGVSFLNGLTLNNIDPLYPVS